MTTLQRDDVDEVNAACIPLLAIACLITRRQNELGSLLGCDHSLDVSRQRFDKFLGRHVATEKLNLQFLGGRILQNFGNALRRLLGIAGLDRREIKLPMTFHRPPRLAMENAKLGSRVARGPTEVLAKDLFMTEGETNKLIGNIQRILLGSGVFEVATLLLERQRQVPERTRCANLVNDFSTLDLHATTVRVGLTKLMGVPDFTDRACADGFANPVGDIGCLNHSSQHLDFQLRMGILASRFQHRAERGGVHRDALMFSQERNVRFHAKMDCAGICQERVMKI